MATTPIFLNHFFLTLDKPTFQAVKAQDWLRTALAPFEERTTKRNDTTYTGIYFYGRNTYFEFFEEGSEPGKVKGASGIAFGVESPGAARQLANILPDQTLITRQVEGMDAPWFHSASPAGVKREDFFRSWVMEYHAEFLEQWHPKLAPENPSALRRRAVLDRYVAKIGEWHHRNDFLLKDVVAIEVNLPPDRAAPFKTLLDAFDYQRTGSTATGPEIRITVNANRPPMGIRSVTFSLQRSVPSDFELSIGSSKLLLSARGQAVWTFTA
jgi:Family of unknown function (DUF5829)